MKGYTRTPCLLIAMAALCLLGGESTAKAGPTNLTITSVINMPYSEFTALKSEFDALKIEFAALKTTSDTHFSNLSNPHQVTKTQVALSNVDNVQQIPMAEKGVANGVATLDANSNLVFDGGSAKIYGNGANSLSYSFDGTCRQVSTNGISGVCAP